MCPSQQKRIVVCRLPVYCAARTITLSMLQRCSSRRIHIGKFFLHSIGKYAGITQCSAAAPHTLRAPSNSPLCRYSIRMFDIRSCIVREIFTGFLHFCWVLSCVYFGNFLKIGKILFSPLLVFSRLFQINFDVVHPPCFFCSFCGRYVVYLFGILFQFP